MILNDQLKEGEQVPSTNQMAATYTLNPATVRKGFNMLTDKSIIYKRRGVGMFVQSGAKELIRNQRRDQFFEQYVLEMLKEANRLGISKDNLIHMIQETTSLSTDGSGV